MKTKKIIRRLVCLMSLLALLVAGVTMPSSAETSDAKVQSYEEQMSALEEKQNEARAAMEATQGDISNSVEYKANLDASISATYQKMQVAQSMIDDLDVKIEEKNDEIAELEDKIDERWERYKERMVIIADDGNLSYLEMLLDAGSLDTFFSNFDAVASIVEYDKQVMQEYRDTIESLNRSKEELAVAQETQEAAISMLEDDAAYLAEASAQTESLISELQKQEEEYAANYEYYKAEEDRIAAELQAYVQKLQEEQQKIYVGGDFMWPLDGFYTISCEFGYRDIPSLGLQDYHRGIDIVADGGTPIHACNSGQVVRSEYHYSWGNYVLIDHGGGQCTLYAHMTATAVSAGSTVSKGDIIGYVGQTGHAYGNHLHLEYWVDGNVTNPHNLGF